MVEAGGKFAKFAFVMNFMLPSGSPKSQASPSVRASTWQEAPGGPPRRYYRLTAKGRKALAACTEEWERFRDAVDQLIGGTP